jgi:hypothetical protein
MRPFVALEMVTMGVKFVQRNKRCSRLFGVGIVVRCTAGGSSWQQVAAGGSRWQQVAADVRTAAF